MQVDFIRDQFMYAAVLGVFGMVWFGWGQENPPRKWRVPLGIGSGLSIAVAVAGAILAFRHWGDASALSLPGAYRNFGIVFGVEVLFIVAGILVLSRWHRARFISSWTAFVVGIHFFPLAWIFQDGYLHLLGAMVVIAAVVPVLLSKRTAISVSAMNGAGAGLVLLAFAVRGLVTGFL